MGMIKSVLITGGGGFIGTNLSNFLINKGIEVYILDTFSEQIHGEDYENSPLFKQLSKDVKVIRGNVLNEHLYVEALKKVDAVVHFAAETGTGQSMYEIFKYTDVNVNGTSKLIETIIKNDLKNVKKLVIASSRAVYGEGAYECKTHGRIYPSPRNEKDMEAGDFEAKCPICQLDVTLVATKENDAIAANSIYGLTKYAQEQIFMIMGKARNIPTIALRYQNVYGPGQSLSNPYTGILSIFSTRIKNNKDINIFEDGLESRDFVYIDDIVDATYLAIIEDSGSTEVYNVGSGVPTTVIEVASKLISAYDSKSQYFVDASYRIGDIRHNYADLSKIKNDLGFAPSVSFSRGLLKFTEWVDKQEVQKDEYDKSINEMKDRGLFVSKK